MISKELISKVKNIQEMSIKCQGNIDKNNEFLLKAIKEHASEIEELFKNNNPHYQKETADLIILALELFDNNKIDPNEPISIRLERIKERIQESMK